MFVGVVHKKIRTSEKFVMTSVPSRGAGAARPLIEGRSRNSFLEAELLDFQVDGLVILKPLLPIQIVVEVDRWTSHIVSPKSAMFQHSSLHDLTSMDLPRAYLMNQVSFFSGSPSTIEARRQIREAVADDEIGAILLHVDFPGGTIAGTKELADDVAAVAKQKLTHSFIEDQCASAALWVASQSAQVFANETAMIGSIGTLSVIHDLSAMATK